MIDLAQDIGLDIKMEENGKLIYGEGLNSQPILIRTPNEARAYFMDPKAKVSENLYYNYRDTALKKDQGKIKDSGFRYDVTVILPGRIGEEYIKSLGHIHPLKSGTKVRFPEIYEIVYGEALFILQKMSNDFEKVEEVYLVHAKQGEKAVMLPEFGHVTVNLGKKPLVMTNWVAASFKSEYEPYEKHHGAAYYLLDKAGQMEIVKNSNYQKVAFYREVKPKSLSEMAAKFGKPMYQQGLANNFANLDYLENPEKYRDKLTAEYCYQQNPNVKIPRPNEAQNQKSE